MPVTRVGSFLCCRQCPTALSHQPPTAYRMQYNLTYRVIKEHEHFIPLDMIVMYASGWMNAEYQIPEALGPMSTHVQVRMCMLLWNGLAQPSRGNVYMLLLPHALGSAML